VPRNETPAWTWGFDALVCATGACVVDLRGIEVAIGLSMRTFDAIRRPVDFMLSFPKKYVAADFSICATVSDIS
jgi:hypothetical protein